MDFARLDTSECFFVSRVKTPVNTSPMSHTSRAAKFNCSTKPCSLHTSSNVVAHLLRGSGFGTPRHNAESEKTQTFILINRAAGALSHVTVDQRNVFQSCNICMLYASLRSISVFTCRSWKTFVHRHPYEVFVILGRRRSKNHSVNFEFLIFGEKNKKLNIF